MNHSEFLRYVQRYVTNVGISPSSLRNMGAPKMVSTARQFLGDLDLGLLAHKKPEDYPEWLNETTNALQWKFPVGAQHWGAARKVVNILMVQAYLNKELNREYSLDRLGDALETPLDRLVAEELCRESGTLPRWPNVCHLKPATSDEYQMVAAVLSEKNRIPRACLDVLLWRRMDVGQMGT
jgi:hypothetical protein